MQQGGQYLDRESRNKKKREKREGACCEAFAPGTFFAMYAPKGGTTVKKMKNVNKATNQSWTKEVRPNEGTPKQLQKSVAWSTLAGSCGAKSTASKMETMRTIQGQTKLVPADQDDDVESVDLEEIERNDEEESPQVQTKGELHIETTHCFWDNETCEQAWALARLKETKQVRIGTRLQRLQQTEGVFPTAGDRSSELYVECARLDCALRWGCKKSSVKETWERQSCDGTGIRNSCVRKHQKPKKCAKILKVIDTRMKRRLSGSNWLGSERAPEISMKELGKLGVVVECCEKGFPRTVCAIHAAVNLKHQGQDQSYCVGVASVAEASEATLWRTATLQPNVVQTDDRLVPLCTADARSGPINPAVVLEVPETAVERRLARGPSHIQPFSAPGTPRAQALPRATKCVEVDRPARTNRRERFVLYGPPPRMNREAQRRGDVDGNHPNQEVNSSLMSQTLPQSDS